MNQDLKEAVRLIKEIRERNFDHHPECPYPFKLMVKCICGAEAFKKEVEDFLNRLDRELE